MYGTIELLRKTAQRSYCCSLLIKLILRGSVAQWLMALVYWTLDWEHTPQF